MLTLGQQLLAKKKKERERIAVPSGVPALDTSHFVKLVSGDGVIILCHKDCAAVSRVLKPLIFPELTAPGEVNDLGNGGTSNGEVVVEGALDVAPPLIVYPAPKPPVSTADKTAKELAAMAEEAAKIPPPPPPTLAVMPNLLAAGVSEIAAAAGDDGSLPGATVIRFPYVPGRLLEIVVQYFHYKQRYEHAADTRPPFKVDPSVALELLRVATKLQC